jgi:hypothetical protein
VIKLAPGSTHEVTHSVTTGLTVERSQTLAKSLGLSAGPNLTGIQAKLSSQMNKEFGLKLDITAQEPESSKLTITNQSDEHYRLFALWHVDQRITVDALDLAVRAPRPSGQVHATWTSRGTVDFMAAHDPFITYAEIHPS